MLQIATNYFFRVINAIHVPLSKAWILSPVPRRVGVCIGSVTGSASLLRKHE